MMEPTQQKVNVDPPFGSSRTERIVLRLSKKIEIICIQCKQVIIDFEGRSIYFCDNCDIGPLCEWCYNEHVCVEQGK